MLIFSKAAYKFCGQLVINATIILVAIDHSKKKSGCRKISTLTVHFCIFLTPRSVYKLLRTLFFTAIVVSEASLCDSILPEEASLLQSKIRNYMNRSY